MKVILVGISKCGTKSMATAFEQLGLKNYDYPEQFMFQRDDWLKIFKRGGTKEDFRRMFANCDSVTDSPACYFWYEILQAYPDVKLVLTQRKNEDVWYESFLNQVNTMKSTHTIAMKLSPLCRYHQKYLQNQFKFFLGHNCFDGMNDTLCKQAYRKHIACVLQNAPKDQLLVYSLDQGWDPLCKFLDVPVPDKPFPHRNKQGSIVKEVMETHEMFVRIKNEILVYGSLLLALVAVFAYWLFIMFA